MAQYAISRVRYSSDGSRVQRLRVHALRGPRLGPPIEVTRSQVLIAIQQGSTFVLAGERSVAPLHLVLCDDWPCLRIDPLASTRTGDDLTGVPEF
jgi:hypothetical protein